MDTGTDGATLIVPHIIRIIGDRLCGPTVRDTVAIGAIVHRITGHRTIRRRDLDAQETLPAVLRQANQFSRADRTCLGNQARR